MVKVDYITPGAWEDGEHPPTVATVRRAAPSFVAPGPQLAPPARIEVLPPTAPELAPPAAVKTVQTLTTSATDRAKGFSIATIPLAAVLGLVGLLGAVTLAGVPIVSGAALLILFGVFAAVWLAAWIWHQSASPDGVALWQVLLHYRLLRAEQKARLERMRGGMDK